MQKPIMLIAELATTLLVPIKSTILLPMDFRNAEGADMSNREELLFLVATAAVTF